MTKFAQSKYETLTFNFAMALPNRYHTRRAYFRWVDTYLVDLADFKPMKGVTRVHRMQMLPVSTLQNVLTAGRFQVWLNSLVERGHGKQGLEQARAAIVTLSDLMTKSGWLDDCVAVEMSKVRSPFVIDERLTERQLSRKEIQMMISAAGRIATSDNQGLRNRVIISMLCMMALHYKELSVARWGDLSLQNGRVVLQVNRKTPLTRLIDVPHVIIHSLDQWRGIIKNPEPQTPLIRRIWKGGRVADHGLSSDGIWSIMDDVIQHSALDHISPTVIFNTR